MKSLTAPLRRLDYSLSVPQTLTASSHSWTRPCSKTCNWLSNTRHSRTTWLKSRIRRRKSAKQFSRNLSRSESNWNRNWRRRRQFALNHSRLQLLGVKTRLESTLVSSKSPVRVASREVTSVSLFNSSDNLRKKVLNALLMLVTRRRCSPSTKSSSSFMRKEWVLTRIWVQGTMIQMPNLDMVLLIRKSGTRLASTKTCLASIELLPVIACKLSLQWRLAHHIARWAPCWVQLCSQSSKIASVVEVPP